MCGCIDKINNDLAEGGRYLSATMPFRPNEVSRPMIDIKRKDTWKPDRRRGKPNFVVATFCPFCGVKYESSSPPPPLSEGE